MVDLKKWRGLTRHHKNKLDKVLHTRAMFNLAVNNLKDINSLSRQIRYLMEILLLDNMIRNQITREVKIQILINNLKDLTKHQL